MSAVGGTVGILLTLSFFHCQRISQVLLTDALNRRVSSAFRATVNSMSFVRFLLIYIVTVPIVGLMIEKLGMLMMLFVLGNNLVGLFLTVLCRF